MVRRVQQMGCRLGGLGLLIMLAALSGCAPFVSSAADPPATADVAPAPGETEPPPTEEPADADPATAAPQDTSTRQPPTAAASPTAGPTPTPYPATWQDWPVVPTVSQHAIDIYWRGIEMGNDPRSFAVIGDCNSGTPIYLGPFDQPGQYNLGQYDHLQETIDNFAGSFGAVRPAARSGFNGASVQSEFFADPAMCEPGETPMECEFRRKNPSIVIISLGTNYHGVDPDRRRDYYASIVEYAISEGVVPILSTKADNLEGDHSINRMIVDLAREYDVPLWNFWAAAQELPGGGIVYNDDGQLYKLSYALPNFTDEVGMQAGWPNRNLTALQTLDAVWRAAQDAGPPDP